MKTWIALAVALAGAGCSKSADAPSTKRGLKLEYPVDVATLAPRQMQYTVTAPGSIDAFQQVQITARVAGAVDKVGFVEGQVVKAGDVLVAIESERYTIALEQARATQLKTQAAQKAAEAALERRKTADRDSPGLVPGEEIEQKQTAVDTAKADVEAARQALRIAELNLRDSSVRAPIPGVVQTRTVQQGQYLQAGAVLATILQREPMLLRFQVSEQDAPRLAAGMPATLMLKETTREYTAKITLVADAADPATRMVPVTAQIDQTDHQHWLRPGAFCEVTVPIGSARQGIVVPSLAVQPTEKGNVVYVVDDKHIAHARVVQLGMHTAEGGVELTRGATAGELMVVRGIEPLSDGAPVKIGSTLTLEAATAPPPAAGAGSGSAAPAAGSADAPPAAPAEPAAGSGSGHRHHKDAP
ncbi:MAG TPA: efflux RND transporter periplasmic adaptor subunit [Kofleriaceae bacterium]|jgi:RND family efflux transporter MFP subunit|nr:efflux RND transporter periplasmic adaptor subunit [Kofleriaceae bacterium]